MIAGAHPGPCNQAGEDDDDDEKDHTGGDGAAERLEDGTHSFLPFWMMGLQRKKV